MSVSCWRLFAACLVLLGLEVSALPSGQAAVVESGSPASAPGTFGETIGLCVKFTQGEPISQLPELEDLGVKWVRLDVAWSRMEPEPGNYLPSFPADVQKQISYCKDHHIGIDFILAYSNPKAYPDTPENPHNRYNAAALGKYAVAMAKLLEAAGVRFVLEIWNEPHNDLQKPFGGNWQGKLPSPWVDQYVSMVKETVAAVHAYNPKITLLDQDDMWICHYWFLEKGLPADLDGISFHPYSPMPEITGVLPDTDWCQPFTVVDEDGSYVSAVRRLRDQGKLKLGHTPQMWVTERGWETGGKSAHGPITEDTIAAYVPRSFIESYAAGVKVNVWFSSYDGPDGPMGLTDNQGRHRKQYFSFKTMTRELSASTLVRQVAGMEDRVAGLQAYLFHAPDGYKLAAWNIDGTAPALLSSTGDSHLNAVDDVGKPVSLPAAVGGVRHLSLGIAPIYISGVPAGVSLAAVSKPVSVVQLDDLDEGATDWTTWQVGNCQTQIAVVKDDPAPGKSSLKLSANIVGAGDYCAMAKDLKELGLADITAFRMRVKSDNVTNISTQLIDGTGQTHQTKGILINADGQWHDLIFIPLKTNGGEHWAGANDGIWHGKPAGINIILGSGSSAGDHKPVLYLTDIRADVVQVTVLQPAAFKADFEGLSPSIGGQGGQLPAGFTANGDASVDTKNGFKSASSLKLTLPISAVAGHPVTVTGPVFPVSPGQWQFSAVTRSDLKSPDDSFSGVVTVQLLDGGGKVAQDLELANVFGQHDWQSATQTVDVPQGVASARFIVRLNKPSGQFWVDDLSAAFMAPAVHRDNRVARLTFSTSALGHLWFPNDPRIVQVTVESTKPLLESQQMVSCDVRDYWGAEQLKPAAVTLEGKGKNGARFVYTGTLDLSTAPLETGRYYELHGAVPRPNDEPFTNYSSFAILPEAATHQYKSQDVPFTSRDWDGRLGDYIRLTDRIGIRVVGLWGGWSPTPPYSPDAPGLDLVQKAGQGWLTGAESASIEGGKGTYDEAALRGGVDTLIAKFGNVRPMIISLGNEPSGSGPQVLKNVEAYRIVYDEIKKVGPTIFVVGTSIGPNEEYFKAGFGKYCDAYDFHTYAGVDDIRGAFADYRRLMKKYDVVKPIWSTEMGMNSQGVARSTVASLMIKKFAIFFAEGGSNASWFDFLYPDGEGTGGSSAAAAHDVFDSRFSLYAPKLTAISYYDIVNAIAVKKFVEEKEYPNGVSAFLFRDHDGKSLQVLWRDKGRADVAVPLPEVNDVQVVLLDGTHRTLQANGTAITTSVSSEPLLLLYDGGPQNLPAQLGTPIAAVDAPLALLGSTSTVKVALDGAAAADINLVAPPFWTVTKQPVTTLAGKPLVQFVVATPQASTASEATYIVTIGPAGARRGELYTRAAVASTLTANLEPTPAIGEKAAGIHLTVVNNGVQPQKVHWTVSLDQDQALSKGQFGPPSPTAAEFAKTSSGVVTIAGAGAVNLDLPLAAVDPLKIYRVNALVTDGTGHSTMTGRLVGGFAGAPRAGVAPKLDGVLDEPEWKSAPVQFLNKADQIHAIDPQMEPWTSPQDVSAALRFLWDDRYLYVGVDETEAVGSAKLQADDSLWAGNGLQFLVDPVRDIASKPGYYDFSLGVGINGPSAWMHSSADAGVPTGLAKDIIVSAKRKDAVTGDITYEVAIPWSRLAPFKPHVGADLGLSMAINTDHGKGRHGFMTWFGDVQDKSLDTVGDVILGE